ncbi:Phycobilisome Linker polypeptide [Synechococcus sp. PCC 7502]|uniref:phycobilisome rod-core linker polypeptide n=1 Tax=Synechococcus sp. PCC 7502 TaxID=1173263 RepID=UPI00029FD433|nr:phycobilisome rod-core linker polypeptide [Synechococcus sp. PCC 7502]AFY75169.1 Phycobilisome Linker polypeptide [Synechococcus sp. PCC 7502]
MSPLPLLTVIPSSQNQRVASFGFADEDDDSPFIYRTENASDAADLEEIIWAAYRQVFSEHVILESNRQTFLESQFKNGQISVRDFVRGLGKSDTYYRLVVEPNSNYRVVELSLKRILGRAPYNKLEEITWSIVIAEQGIGAFIDALVDSDEYEQVFGENTLPYQRKRLQERPFNLVTPRYGADYRDSAGITKYDWQFTLQKYFTAKAKTRRLPEGDPGRFREIAQSIAPKVNYAQKLKASDIPDYLAAVPYRGRR